MMKYLIPQSLSEKVLLFIAFAISVIVYLFRIGSKDLLISNALGILCIPVLCIMFFSVPVFIFGLIFYTFKSGGHPAPIMVTFVGILVAVILPVPSQYEASFFQTHQKEYEYLVDLAKEHQLEHSQRCNINRSYEPPGEYAELSSECILIDYQPIFSVQFAPRIYVEQIVYIEDPSRIETVIGCNPTHGGDFVEQLDVNWFLCSMSP